MPAIPYKPFPDQEPTDRATPYLNVRALPEAFGVNIGEALQRGGDELFGRAMALQQLRNNADADELASKYTIESSKLRANYQTLEGKDAPDALESHMKQLEELRQKIGGEAKNDFTRKLYDGHTRGFMSREVYSAAQHAATENKRYNTKVIDDKEVAVHDEAAHRPDSNKTYTANVTTLRDIYHQRAALKGWDLDTEQIEYQKGLSKLLYTRITSLAKADPQAAQQMLKDNEINLYGDDLPKATDIVASHMIAAGARQVAEDIVKPSADGKFDKSETEYIQEANKRADEERPGDALYKSAVQDAVISKYRKFDGARREDVYRYENILSGALIGEYGKLPTSVAEMLKLDPRVADAWQHLDAQHRRKFFTAISTLQKMPDLERKHYEDSQEGIDRYNELIGMKARNPEAFMNTHIPGESFTRSTLQSLIRMQGQIGQKAEDDPRLSRALTVLKGAYGPTMIEQGIDKLTREDPEKYYRFIGALQMELDRFREEHKAPPKEQDIKDIGQRLMFQQAVPRFFGLFTGHEEPVYNITVPDEIKQKFVEEYKKEFKDIPTDEQIRRAYVRHKLREMGKPLIKTPAQSKKEEQDNPANPENRKPPLKQRKPDPEDL